MSWSYNAAGTKAAIRADILKQSAATSGLEPDAAKLLLPLLVPEPNECGGIEIDAGGHNGKLYKLTIRQLPNLVK